MSRHRLWLDLACAACAFALFFALTPAHAALAAPPAEGELAAALALRHDGYYEESLAALRALVTSGDTSPEALNAVAEGYELVGDWPAAAEAWRVAGDATTSEEQRARAIFHRAESLRQAGDCARAARLYRYFLQLRPESGARFYALEGIAECYGTAGYWWVAARYYAEALEVVPASEDRADVVLALADALLLAGDEDGALALFEAESTAVPADDLPRFLFRWGLAERAAGQEQAGLERLSSLVASYPRSSFAHPALVIILDAGLTVDEHLRGVVDYYAGAYEPAVAAFARYVEADPDGHAGSAHYYAGLSYRALGDYPKAIGEFDLLITTHPEDPDLAAGWLAKGDTLARSGDAQRAADAYRALAGALPEHELAPEALLRAGAQLESLGIPDEAVSVYEQLQAAYPAAKQAAPAALRAGLLRARAGRWSDAETAFGSAVSLCGECGDLGRYRFWLARSLLAQDKTDEADAALAQVAGAYPRDYYSYRASLLLSGEPFQPAPAGNLLLDPGEGARAEAEAWLQATFDPAWQPGQMPASVSGDSRFAEMEEYTSLGLRAEAVACALSLSRDLGHDAIGQYSLALWLREHELYRPSIQAAANIIYTTGWSRSVPAFIWRLVYPSYYDDLVVGEAFSNGLDPLLFFALLRQESLYDPLIGSSAGAQGLAQVMPATGEWIAGQLGEAYVVSDLLRPNVAVRYGAWYLAQQLAYLDGDPLAGLAAYNAGPGNAVKWRDAGGGDPDFFYEAIAFSETRRYLDTILPNYYFYAWLYAGRE